MDDERKIIDDALHLYCDWAKKHDPKIADSIERTRIRRSLRVTPTTPLDDVFNELLDRLERIETLLTMRAPQEGGKP